MKSEPSQRRLRLWYTIRLEHAVDDADASMVSLGVVSASVHRHEVALRKASPLDLACCEGAAQEAAGLQAVGDELHAVHADQVDGRPLVPAVDEVVDALVYARLHVTLALADNDEPPLRPNGYPCRAGPVQSEVGKRSVWVSAVFRAAMIDTE